jgi:arylformamidase
MRVIDVTLPISADMLTWPGDPSVEILPSHRLARGDSANVSELKMGTHTGTHVDAPFHFIDGAPGVDQIPLLSLYGTAAVVDVRDVEDTIGPDEVKRVPDGARRVLFQTRNSEIWRDPSPRFPEHYVSVTPDGARALVDVGVMLVGVDFLSVEKRGSPGHPTHVTLLEAGVVIVEGLNLSDVEPGDYTIACMPLKLAGMDGAPARVFLIES